MPDEILTIYVAKRNPVQWYWEVRSTTRGTLTSGRCVTHDRAKQTARREVDRLNALRSVL